MSRARDFADLAGSADAGGLTGRNLIINGGMMVNQRAGGVDVANNIGTANAYTIDHIQNGAISGSTGDTIVYSREFGQTDAMLEDNGFTHYGEFYNDGDRNVQFWFPIEDGLKQTAQKTYTLSFWARCESGTLVTNPHYGQQFGSGGSAANYVGISQITVNTTWTRYSSTFTPASLSGKTIGTGSYLAMHLSGVAANGGNKLYLTGVQLEVGEQATPFEHRSYQDEYLRATRYFYQWKSNSGYHKVGFGRAWSTSNCVAGVFRTPVPMRVLPTLTNSGLGDFAVAGVGGTPTAMGIAESSTDFRTFTLSVDQTSAFTIGTIYQTETDNVTGAYLRFDSEL